MDLHRPGWLREFLILLLAEYRPERAWARLSAGLRDESLAMPESPRRMALRHLELELRRSGLIYGSPKLPSRISQGTRLDRADAHFLSVLAGECFVALDVSRSLGLSFDPERAHVVLSVLLAAAVGRIDLASSMAAHLGASGRRSVVARLTPPMLARSDELALSRLQQRLESALLERVALATGDTVFDLPLHNGKVFGEARLIGRLALDLHQSGAFRPAYASRLLAASHRERARLLPVLVAPSRLLRPPEDLERRTVSKELRGLRIPRAMARRIRATLEAQAGPSELVEELRTRSSRRFAMEQAWLASMIGGLDSAEERFLAGLAEALGFDRQALDSIETEIADYFYDGDEIIDSFEIRAKAQENSGKLVDRIERDLVANLDRIALEVKETGELAQLLGKVARGQELDRIEREKVREQLLDLAKVVPSLAIIAAPGGMFIFAALLKILPFSLLPSSFQQSNTAARPRRPTRLRTRSRRPQS